MNKTLSLDEQTEVMHSVMDEKMHVSLSLSLTEDVITELNKQHYHIVQFVEDPPKSVPVFETWDEFYTKNPHIRHTEIGLTLQATDGDIKPEFKVRGLGYYFRPRHINA
jgi:hypothetical protein